MELPHDLIEETLSRLVVKSFLKFKCVSKSWKSIIESPHFQRRHINHHQSQDPVLILANGPKSNDVCVMRILELGSSISIQLPCPYPPPSDNDFPGIVFKVPNAGVSNSCDGLICFNSTYGEIFVVNPSTRWYRQVHGAMMEKLSWAVSEKRERTITCGINGPGFGKDICTGMYKIVWLYNNFTSELIDVTTCEVFDFDTNTWRYVKSPHCDQTLLDTCQYPIYINGSVYWLIKDNSSLKSSILSFDFHKETFQVTLETPTVLTDPKMVNISNLNDRICISERNWPTQNIWLLNHSDNTWEKIYSLHLPFFPPTLIYEKPVSRPLAILKKKNKLLLDGDDNAHSLVLYDHDLRSYGRCFKKTSFAHVIPYFPSLISIP